MSIDIDAIEREWGNVAHIQAALVASRHMSPLIARVRELEAENDQLRGDYSEAISLCVATEEFCSGAISEDELMAAVEQWGGSDDE